MADTRKRILIIEDEPQIAEIVSRILGAEKAVISRAGTIGEAEALFNRETFDIVILDRMLPDGDGVQIFRKLKSDPALSHMPVLILSAKDMAEEQAEGLDLGADDYLTKPFSSAELRARVDVLLRRSAKFAK